MTEGVVSNNKVREIESWIKENNATFKSQRIIFSGQEDPKEAKDFLIKAFYFVIFNYYILIATFNGIYFA